MIMHSGLCHADFCVSLQELFMDIYLVFFSKLFLIK